MRSGEGSLEGRALDETSLRVVGEEEGREADGKTVTSVGRGLGHRRVRGRPVFSSVHVLHRESSDRVEMSQSRLVRCRITVVLGWWSPSLLRLVRPHSEAWELQISRLEYEGRVNEISEVPKGDGHREWV